MDADFLDSFSTVTVFLRVWFATIFVPLLEFNFGVRSYRNLYFSNHCWMHSLAMPLCICDSDGLRLEIQLLQF